LPGATTVSKLVPQFKKTKSSRNVFGKAGGRGKGASKNLLLVASKGSSENRNKSENHREENVIDVETDDTNPEEINAIVKAPNMLTKRDKKEEYKIQINNNLLVSPLDDTSDLSDNSSQGKQLS